MTAASAHIPVLLREVVEAISPRDGGLYVDGTFGGGGYSQALLDAAQGCVVWGIDRDPEAIRRGAGLAARYGDRLRLVEGRYGDMDRLLAERGVRAVDGVALDIGVSSFQIDDPARGFSVRHDGPLDMRMGAEGSSAADLVNSLPEAALADLIYRLGEERASRRVAHAITAARKTAPITRTGQLAEIVRKVVPAAKDGIDPATRTFQALRIAVNDELVELERGLSAAERLLVPGGRLAVVSFHSLEDRRVKEFLRARSGDAPRPSRHLPAAATPAPASFRLLKRAAITPGPAEAKANPRARSAKLRTALRTAAPAFPAPWGAPP